MTLKLLNSLICEDIRKEADGKLSLLGVFPKRVIIVPSDEALPMRMQALNFYMQLETTVDDVFSARFLATPPSGANPEVYPEIDAGKVVVNVDKENVIHIKLRDFPLLEYGKYKVDWKLREQSFSLDFDVKAAD